MTPLPLAWYGLGGLALGVVGVRLLARWARAGGAARLAAGVAAIAVAVDALHVLVQRGQEALHPPPGWLLPALAAALALARVRAEWRGLAGPGRKAFPDRREGV